MSHPRQQFVDQGRSKLRTGLFLARRVVDSLPRARPSQPSPPSQPSTPRDTLLSDPTDAAFVLFEVSALQTACPSWSPCAVKGSAPGNWITGSPTLVPSDPVGSTDISPLLLLSQQRCLACLARLGLECKFHSRFFPQFLKTRHIPTLSRHTEKGRTSHFSLHLSPFVYRLSVLPCAVLPRIFFFFYVCVCVCWRFPNFAIGITERSRFLLVRHTNWSKPVTGVASFANNTPNTISTTMASVI